MNHCDVAISSFETPDYARLLLDLAVDDLADGADLVRHRAEGHLVAHGHQSTTPLASRTGAQPSWRAATENALRTCAGSVGGAVGDTDTRPCTAVPDLELAFGGASAAIASASAHLDRSVLNGARSALIAVVLAAALPANQCCTVASASLLVLVRSWRWLRWRLADRGGGGDQLGPVRAARCSLATSPRSCSWSAAIPDLVVAELEPRRTAGRRGPGGHRARVGVRWHRTKELPHERRKRKSTRQ
jgi:hypothetical protein